MFKDGPTVSVTAAPPVISTYNSGYGLSSSYYSAPKVAISTPAVSKVIATPAVATYSTPAIASTYSAAPAVSTYYSANKLAYANTPTLATTSYVSAAPVKQVAYAAAPALTQYASPYSSTYGTNYGSTHGTNYGSTYGSYGSAYSSGHNSGYSSGYGSTYGLSKLAYSAPATKIVSSYASPAVATYSSPAVTSSYVSPAITSSYVAANKFAYAQPAVAQYAASYTPSVSTSYYSTPIAKQVSYATNPLVSGAYVSGYKSGAYVAPAVATTLGSAGYHTGASLGYVVNYLTIY